MDLGGGPGFGFLGTRKAKKYKYSIEVFGDEKI